MKTWRTKHEWMNLCNCAHDVRFTAEKLTVQDYNEVREICRDCVVRPECMQWAIREQACSVVVAGVMLPDPAAKRTLRRTYRAFAQAIPRELEARGEEI